MRYDATRASLLHPEEQATLFCPGQDWPIEAVCAECSRLAYVRFEADERGKATLTEAIARAGLTDPQFFSDPRTGTQAFAAIGAGGSAAFIVFRGTQPDDPSDIGTDAQAVLVDWHAQGKVHLGFRDALAASGTRLNPGSERPDFRPGSRGTASGPRLRRWQRRWCRGHT